MRKYNLRCQYCGTDKYVSEPLLKIRLIIFGEIRHQCKCGKESRYKLIGHIVHDIDKTEKETNKKIKANQEKVKMRG